MGPNQFNSMNFCKVVILTIFFRNLSKLCTRVFSKFEQTSTCATVNKSHHESFLSQIFALKGFSFELCKIKGSRGNEKYNYAKLYQMSISFSIVWGQFDRHRYKKLNLGISDLMQKSRY